MFLFFFLHKGGSIQHVIFRSSVKFLSGNVAEGMNPNCWEFTSVFWVFGLRFRV